MTTSDHRHSNQINNGHNNNSKDDEIDSGKYYFSMFIYLFIFYFN